MSVAPVSEYILGIDVLWDLALQTTVGEFRLQQKCVSVWAVQAILRSHVKHEPVHLLELCQITNMRQYRLRGGGGQDEISRTVQELETVGIIRPEHSLYNSTIWPV